MGRKPRLITEEQYEKIGFLARRLVSKKFIASELGYSERGLYKRLETDTKLRDSLQKNYDKGAIALYISQYDSAVEHKITHCKNCRRSADLVEVFLEDCPWCHSTDITHEYIPSNIQMLIWMGKIHLGQSDKVIIEHRGSSEYPIHSKKFSEEEHARKMRDLLPFLKEQYGDKKEPERGHDDLLVDIKRCA